MAMQPLTSHGKILSGAPRTQKARGLPGAFDSALALAKSDKPAAGASAPAGETYTVRPGDTLYGVARRLKMSLGLPQSTDRLVKELTGINHVANPNRIYPGQLLRLPGYDSKPFSLPEPKAEAMTTAGAREVQVFPGEIPAATPEPVPQEPDPPELGPPELAPHAHEVKELPISALEPGQPLPGGPDPELPGFETGLPISPLPSFSMPQGKLSTQIAIYKEDQLLAHPGGDNYFIHRTAGVYDPDFDRRLFQNRVGKDLADVGENLLNMVKDLATGSKFKYVDKDGEIKDGKRVGFLSTMKNFFEDLLSGLSFGAYVPAGEKAPEGPGASLLHFAKKVFYDAPFKDLLVGIPHSGINIVKNALFAGLNLLQVVPDATIGNFDWGHKLTTTVFDNGQVVVDYLTDIVPGGEAWLRVHAAGSTGEITLPILYNLKTSEQGVADSRWATVRNTPFRKTIETLGSLLADGALSLTAAGRIPSTSTDQRHP